MRALSNCDIFPLTFAAGMGTALYSLHASWSPDLTVAGITLTTALVVALFERVHPAHPEWNQARGNVGTDLTHGLVSQVLLPRSSIWACL